MTSLGPQFGGLFHGTTHAIKDGVVKPADSADKPVSEYSFGDPGDMSEGDHAFAIKNDEAYAWHAATNFHPSQRRARVYEVEPTADMKPGPWNKDHPNFLEHNELDNPDDYPTPHPDSDDYPQHQMMKELADDARQFNSQDEWGSKTGFPVKQRIDIKPGHQGTFPSIAWGRFSKTPYAQSINHPNDDAVQYGHETGDVDKIHNGAMHHNEQFDAADPRAPKRRGARLKEFMLGNDKAVPDPHHGQGTMF